MRSASRIALTLLTLSCTRAPSHAIARLTAESEVRTAERQRFEAMVRQDVAALDTLLDEDLTYVHSSGELQTKAQFLELIRSRGLVYESIAPSEVQVRGYNDIEIATGRSQMRLRSATGVSSFGIRFTEVYIRRNGRWLLTAWESAPIGS